jgi:hypothetical protein
VRASRIVALILRTEVPMLVPKGIVVHISASHFGDAKQIDSWHKQKGWAGIGYHRVILNGVRTGGAAYAAALDGTVENGRADTVVGAHCQAGGMNVASLGVCCIGTPDRVPAGATRAPATATTKPYLTAKQWGALVDLLARLCRQHGMNPQGTFTHPRTGGSVPVLTQHSTFDPGKPFCASLNLATLRTAVAQAMTSLPPARRARRGAAAERFLLEDGAIPVAEPEVDPPVGDVGDILLLQPEDVGTLEPAGGTRRGGRRPAATKTTTGKPRAKPKARATAKTKGARGRGAGAEGSRRGAVAGTRRG